MIVVVASAIIRIADTYLLVKEVKPSAAGKWSLPGGKLEEGESIVDCVRREVYEETGYNLDGQDLLTIVNKPNSREGNSVIKFVFVCRVSEPASGPTEHEMAFLPLTDIRSLNQQGLIRGDEVVALLESVTTLPTAGTQAAQPLLRIIE